MRKIFIRVGLVLGILVLGLISTVFISIKSAQNDPPPLITANFTQLSKIEKISKYRSCAGHVTVPQDGRESRRNMKHYFWVKPEYNKEKTVEIYSPYDGYIADVRSDLRENLEGEIWISSQQIFFLVPPFGVWTFSVQHIDIKPGLKLGDKVKAGDLIGWLAVTKTRGNSFDIVYGKSGFPPKKIDNWTGPFADLDSVFNHMSDEVLGEYQKKGASKEKLIITKEERDQNLCEYTGEGPYFAPHEDSDDWVKLF